jgi:hypothetical protein
MAPWTGRRTLAVVTACLNAAGVPDLALSEVEVTHDEYADGVHCERVEDRLAAAGYHEPFLHYDDGPAARCLLPCARLYLIPPAARPDPAAGTTPEEDRCRASSR